MSKSQTLTPIFLCLIFPFADSAAAQGGSKVNDLETGFVFASPWLTGQRAAATLGYQDAEQVDLTIGTVAGPRSTTRGAGVATYYLSQEKYGFAVAAEYAPAGAAEHLINSVALGLGADPVQAGINLHYNATTWASHHTLNIRVGRDTGLAGALIVSDISNLSDAFTLGLGFKDPGKFTMEVSCPVNTDAILNDFGPEIFVWDLSVSVLSIPKAQLNVGISGVRFGEQGGGTGQTHAGFAYWVWANLAVVATVNKRYVYTLGVVGDF